MVSSLLFSLSLSLLWSLSVQEIQPRNNRHTHTHALGGTPFLSCLASPFCRFFGLFSFFLVITIYRNKRQNPPSKTTTASERPSGASWRFSPPFLHMLAIPRSKTTPQRPLKITNQTPPKPLCSKTPFPSAPQSDTRIPRQPLATARRINIFILSQNPSPQFLCPKRRRFQVAMLFLGPLRETKCGRGLVAHVAFAQWRVTCAPAASHNTRAEESSRNPCPNGRARRRP